MGEVFMSGIVPQLSAPITTLLLGDIAEGSLVKIKESGSPVEFYVSKHNYNTGRTLLIRKSLLSGERRWNNDTDGSNFLKSDIYEYLNGTYKNTLDSATQTAIASTSVHYYDGVYYGLKYASMQVFLPSMTELGGQANYMKVEGTELPIAKSLYGVSTFWTRTQSVSSTETRACVATSYGSGAAYTLDTYSKVRPCFTLPATAQFDPKTLVFSGVV